MFELVYPSKDSEPQNRDILSAISLPCGRVLNNRLVKVALYEHLADFFSGPPNRHHTSLYSTWAKYNWGMIVTGNVQVSKKHLTLGRDMVIPDHISDDTLKPFKALALAITGSRSSGGPIAVMQLSHAGRQSSNFIGGRYPFQSPLAPSAIRVRPKDSQTSYLSDVFHRLIFQTPHSMSVADIDDVVAEFVRGATVALQSGFDGIQLHVAHGYLLSQFMSPKSNTRSDDYSCDQDNALRLLYRVISSIRKFVPKEFIVGIKLNSADYTDTLVLESSETTIKHEQEDRALGHICTIASWGGVDFIEISGGDYESPDFLNSVTSPSTKSKSPRQAFFARFSHRAMQALRSIPRTATSPPPPLILLTGGLRTPRLLSTAISSQHAHLLGIGRGSVLCPHLPQLLMEQAENQDYLDTPFGPEPDLITSSLKWIFNFLPKIPLIGAGANMAWYIIMMRRLASVPSKITGGDETEMVNKMKPDYTIGGTGAVIRMWLWTTGDQNPVRRKTASDQWLFAWTSFIVIIGVSMYRHFFE